MKLALPLSLLLLLPPLVACSPKQLDVHEDSQDTLATEREPDSSSLLQSQIERILAEQDEMFLASLPTVDAANLLDTDSTASTDIWNRLRAGFRMEIVDHPRVQKEIDWYVSHPDYLERVFTRAQPFMYYVLQQIEQNDLPYELALLPVVESAYQPFAYSHGRAAGMWQFIPSTGRIYGMKQNWWYDGRRDVVDSTDGAMRFFKHLGQAFDNNWNLALASYNSGAGTVTRAVERNRRRGKPTDFFSLDLPVETQAYVPKLMAITAIVADPAKYGITLPGIPDEPALDIVDVGSQIDLALAAELADMEISQIYMLNPGYNRWATDPTGPHRLMVPLEKAAVLRQALNELPPEARVRWVRHEIRPGQTLSEIARQYSTTVDQIKRANHISGNSIRAGHHLMIPKASKDLHNYALSASQRLQRRQSQGEGEKLIHLVQKGDTLWDISRHYGVSVKKLASWNGMAPRDPLHLGQKLVIWKKGANASSASIAPLGNPLMGSQSTQKVSYTVRKGDSLARIADRFRVSIANLKRWNKLDGNKYLQPGQRLTLFVDITKQSSS